MGQQWTLFNFDTKQFVTGSELTELLFCGGPNDYAALIRAPRRPRKPEFLKIAEDMYFKTRKRRQEELRVPTVQDLAFASQEIVRTILANLDDIMDIGHFSLVNTFICNCGLNHINDIQETINAPWLGGRLVCLGNVGLLDCDFPPSLGPRIEELKDEIRRELSAGDPPSQDSEQNVACERDDPVDEATLLDELRYDINYAWEHIQYPTCPDLDRLKRTWIDRRACRHDPHRKQLRDLTSISFQDPKYRRILCNLSKREYVRESALLELSANWDSLSFITLGEVLICRVSWSSSDVTHLPDGAEELKLHRGVWAGDRFKIIAEDELKSKDMKEWKDVTDDVVQEVDKIWSYEFGPNWRVGSHES